MALSTIETPVKPFTDKMLGWMKRPETFDPQSLTVRIANGNDKLGKDIPNVNTAPPLTCTSMPCLTSGCYAMKSFHRYPNVRESQFHNTNLYYNHPELYFNDIINQMNRKRKPTPYFRWHSSGEIIDLAYFEGMKKVARALPNTKFLCFTKKFLILSKMRDVPENLAIIFSTWKGMKLAKRISDNHNIAWVLDGSDFEANRIAKQSNKPFVCGGDCEVCKACWYTNSKNHDVVFHKH